MTGAPAGSAPRLLPMGRMAGLVAGLAVLGVTLWRVGWSDVGDVLGSASPLPLVGALLLNAPILLLRALRTRALLGPPERDRVRLPLLVESQLVGQTFSALTPGASGDLWRAVMWQRAAGTPLGRGVTVVVAERVVSLFLLLGTGLVLLVPAAGGPGTAAAVTGAGVGLALLPFVLLALLARHPGSRHLAGSVLRRGPLRHRASSLGTTAGAVAELLLSPGVIALVVTLSLAVFLLGGLQIVLVAGAIGGGAGLGSATAAACLSQGLGSLSGLPFGLGVGDASTVAVLARVGVDSGIAAGVAILVRLCVTLPTTALAAGVLVLRGDRAGAGRGLEVPPTANRATTAP